MLTSPRAYLATVAMNLRQSMYFGVNYIVCGIHAGSPHAITYACRPSAAEGRTPC